MVDGSIRQPYEKLEDIVVRVENCCFLVDFIMAYMKVTENLSHAPIILGRPFLATAQATTDGEKGTAELKVGKEKVEIQISKLLKFLESSSEHVCAYDVMEDVIAKENKSPLNLTYPYEEECEPDEDKKYYLLTVLIPELELKPIPSSVKYVFLGPDETFLVIISS